MEVEVEAQAQPVAKTKEKEKVRHKPVELIILDVNLRPWLFFVNKRY